MASPEAKDSEQSAGDALSLPKPKATSLRTKVLQEVSKRSIDDVLADAKHDIQACTEEIAAAEADGAAVDEEVQKAEQAMEDARKHVQEALDKESLAIAKLKGAKLAQSTSASGSMEAQQMRADTRLAVRILQLEIASRTRLQELEADRERAQAEVEAAKQAFEESKLREKEVQDTFKSIAQEQRVKADEIFQEHCEHDKVGAQILKERNMAIRAAAQQSALEIAEIEKARSQRDKERLSSLKALSDNGSMKRAGCPPKRPLSIADGNPNKVAKTVD